MSQKAPVHRQQKAKDVNHLLLFKQNSTPPTSVLVTELLLPNAVNQPEGHWSRPTCPPSLMMSHDHFRGLLAGLNVSGSLQGWPAVLHKGSVS